MVRHGKCALDLSQTQQSFFIALIDHHLRVQLSVPFCGCPEEVTFTIQWYLKYYPCHNEFNNIEVSM